MTADPKRSAMHDVIRLKRSEGEHWDAIRQPARPRCLHTASIVLSSELCLSVFMAFRRLRRGIFGRNVASDIPYLSRFCECVAQKLAAQDFNVGYVAITY
jgi:hypothetical protein